MLIKLVIYFIKKINK